MYSIIKTLRLSALGSSRNFDAGVPESELPGFNFRLKKIKFAVSTDGRKHDGDIPCC
jgi:hypothetical protein